MNIKRELKGKKSVNEFDKNLQKRQCDQERQQDYINKIIKEKDDIFEDYKNVIKTATQNKVLLLSRENFIEKMSYDSPIYSTKITEVQDITRCRQEIDNVLTMKKFTWWKGKGRVRILLCLSEAVTNVIKHAGSGNYTINKES